MKNILVYLFLCISINVAAQAPIPSAYNSSAKVNYVRTWEPKKAETNPEVVTGLPVTGVKQITSYVDGLGSTIQTVIKQATPLGKDLVTYKTFDEWGRETYQYLPYPGVATNGEFKTNPFIEQQKFYATPSLNNDQYAGEQFYYGLTVPEPSPMGRPQLTMAVGNSWTGNGIGIGSHYEINTSDDQVSMWSFESDGTLVVLSQYTDGSLFKNVTVDENNNQVIEFNDKDGKVILKRVQIDDIALGNSVAWLETYYIYDKFGNITYVLQPRGVKLAMDNGGVATLDMLNEFAFQYQYDQRNRMIIKKIPGAEEVWMVYDKFNRLICNQDGNLRTSGRWLYTKYDILNRPIYTGFLNYSNDRVHLQQDADDYSASYSINYESPDVNADLGYTSNKSFPVVDPTQRVLTITHYDDYAWTQHYDAKYQQADASFFSTLLTPDNSTFPFPQVFSIAPSTLGLVTGMITYQLKDGNVWSNKRMIAVPFYDEKGRVIQTKSDNITNGFDINTTQYSYSGQALTNLLYQENATDPANLKKIWQSTTMDYDANGRLLKITKGIKDYSGTQQQHGLGKVIVENEYDELGELKKKRLGPIDDTHAVEELNYKYNIRGWLRSINKDFLSDASRNYFGMELAYDDLSGGSDPNYLTPQLNGNIAGVTWRSLGDLTKRRYDFKYDKANRLLEAVFVQDNNSNSWDRQTVDYTVQMGDGVHHVDNNDNDIGIDYKTAYDENGNILQMQQWGLKLNSSSQIDNLYYHYQNNSSNKLQSVIDGNNDENSKLGDFKTLSSHPQWPKNDVTATDIHDYDYDNNGNLMLDNNKAISNISYNYLNLPYRIETAKGNITYQYDAAGNKLQKSTMDFSDPLKTVTITTTYLGGTIYESKQTSFNNSSTPTDPTDHSDELQFISHEEGRIRPLKYDPEGGFGLGSPQSMVIDYFIKDHLGDTRAVLTDEIKVDKYPVASLEPAKSTIENNYYTINTGQITSTSGLLWLPSNYTNGDNGIGTVPTDAAFEAANSEHLYKLNGNTEATKTGLGITLKVMAGDKIDIFGKSIYHSNNTGGSSSNIPAALLTLLNGFLGTPGGVTQAGSHGAVIGTDINSSPAGDAINLVLGNQNTDVLANPQVPKAYINYLFFNEQFKCVGGGFSKVEGSPDIYKQHHSELEGLTVPKNGFVYIYCSNESPVDVFFDNFQVVHTRGPVLEETHYYPFGLTMAGISSKAAGETVENKKKYNGIEFDNDLDINLYEAFYRDLDPQIGRFLQIDPKIEKQEDVSPYSSMANDPTLKSDPLGDEPNGPGPLDLTRIISSVTQGVINAANWLGDAAKKTYDMDAKWVSKTASQLEANRKANWESGNTIIQQLPKDFLANPMTFVTMEGEFNILSKGIGLEVKGGEILGNGARSLETKVAKAIESPAAESTTIEEIVRPGKGGDGATSKHLIEKDASGNTVSVTHQVTKDGEIIHQHQRHVSQNVPPASKPTTREFPDEWIQHRQIVN